MYIFGVVTGLVLGLILGVSTILLIIASGINEYIEDNEEE